ncbi:putative lipid II flippase FtsW [Candidatus Roizmanbacteria bacterium]|nr:putative lipid II flippase FtsW [Candidatus Roizmanbacteria bacterium]
MKLLHKSSFLTTLFFLPLALAIFGVFFVFEASSIRSLSEYGESFRYAKLQLLWIVIGFITMAVVSKIDYHKWYYFAFLMMGGTIMLLVAVLIPALGHSAGGARRWIDLGFFNLQPTEFAKVASIIYLSSWFIHRERKRFFSFLILLCILMGLIMLQPDMGTAIIIFSLSIGIYFLAGIELHYLLYFLPVSVAAFLLMVKLSPYRFQRLTAFLNPDENTQGVAYHIHQVLISLTNGGLWGQGFGASRQKYLFLPEAHTDSIFAIIGEEIGFIGSIGLIIAFIVLIYQLFKISEMAPDRFGRLLAGGIFVFFSLQIIVNLGSMVSIMPMTGVPLPFISYGGSNLLTSFFLAGVAINIGRQSKMS